MANYKHSREADKTLESIYEYSLINFGMELAQAYFLSLHQTFDLLSEQPQLGRKFYSYRRHEHLEHIIFYKERDRYIEVLHLLHKNEDISRVL